MTCASCAHYRAHKARAGIGMCKLMAPRKLSNIEQPALIAAEQKCYFAVVKFTPK